MVGGVEDIFTTVCAVVRTRTVAGAKPVHDICGTAFAVSPRLFMTAAHILDGDRREFSLGTRVGTGPYEFRIWPVLDWELFSGADIALVRCDLPDAVCRSWYPNEVDMLTTAHAFGYPFAVDLHNLRVRARALKGHIVCADDAGAAELPGMPRIYELSFQSPRGLSGAPLLLPTNQGLLVGGVVVANRTTSLQLLTEQESITEHANDGKPRTIVERHEVMHLGMAVQSKSILSLSSKMIGGTIASMFAANAASEPTENSAPATLEALPRGAALPAPSAVPAHATAPGTSHKAKSLIGRRDLLLIALTAVITVGVDRLTPKFLEPEPDVILSYGMSENPNIARDAHGNVVAMVRPATQPLSSVAPYFVGPFWVMNGGKALTRSAVTVNLDCGSMFPALRDLGPSPSFPMWLQVLGPGPESTPSALRYRYPIGPLRLGDREMVPGFWVAVDKSEYHCRLTALSGSAKPAVLSVMLKVEPN